jgi:hypothetical protein
VSNQSLIDAWDMKDGKLQQAIMVSIDSEMLTHTRDKATAALQWAALHTAFSPQTKTRRFNLYHQLITNSFPTSYTPDTMQNYISHMATLKRQLSEMGQPLEDEWYAYLILKALPPSFSSVKTVIEINDTYNYESIKAKLLEEWDTRAANGTFISTVQNTVPIMTAMDKGKKEQKPTIVCNYCKKKNHKEEDCYKKLRDERDSNKEIQVVPVGWAQLRESEMHEHYLCSATHSSPVFNTPAFAAATLTPDADRTFMIDSGAGRHITGDSNLLLNWVESPLEITLADNSPATCPGYGSVELETDLGHTIRIQRVYYLPNGRNIFSVGQLKGTGYAWWLDGTGGRFIDAKGKLVGTTTLNATSTYSFNAVIRPLPVPVSIVSVDYNLLHRRHGHASFNVLSKMYPGIKEPDQPCETCILGATKSDPYRKSKPI